ncbi:MAG: DUF2283 domain-containing protein [Dehalococcoidia bacterium]|uniref:DUF2283 domain-containing protein n=1 Tax=Candidatus Amarobacter glycogenicus TaxID=3140699 RepID=UPI001D1CD74F|nr:DUF2283 domain-containing protein [Dehalococcoidia bacterium]MBK7725308.1 DUF2283 domain-containing protein [Dehalococcoidia bacterium]
MKLSYDPRYNVAYISLREGAAQVESVTVGEDLAIDVDAEGRVVGIEFLNANVQLKGEGTGQLLVVNEADGQTTALPLAV